MSELKYYKLFHRTSALTSPEFISIVEFGNGDEVYLKSEADKVIADMDCEIKKLKDSLDTLLKAKTEQIIHEVIQKTLIYGEGFIRVQDAMKLIAEIRHIKYKRCLAMASKCRLRARWFGDMDFYKKEQWALKWHRRWLELAEKFKEAE